MREYIHQRKNWPNFTWDPSRLVAILAETHQAMGVLVGKMQALGFQWQHESLLNTFTLDIVKSGEIENEFLDAQQVRSSIARRLGIQAAGLVSSDRYVDGVVEIMLDATQYFDQPLTQERLFAWHAALFPTGRSNLNKIVVGDWRDDQHGPMQVVSGPIGRERVHFEAPIARRLQGEMKRFLAWFNEKQAIDTLIKAGIAHLWFVTIHPFDDGNGRLARTITDLQLARADGNKQRFYSMSAEIKRQQAKYYQMLEVTQRSDLDITVWLEWFIACIGSAIASSEATLVNALKKSQFWETHKHKAFNERQCYMINQLFGDFVGKLTTSKWAKMTKCSQDTALRDIQDLMQHHILVKEEGGGRSTSYLLKY